MFYENELRFLQKALEKCHLNSQIIDPSAPLRTVLDPHSHPIIGGQQDQSALHDVVMDIRSATMYRLMDVYLCRYIFVELPYCEPPSVLLIGPYLNNTLTHQQILEQSEHLGLPPHAVREVERFYGSVPVVREEHHLFALVNTFAEYVFSGEDNYDNVDLYFDQSGGGVSHLLRNKPTVDVEAIDAEIMERRYQFENGLMEAVSQGNTHKAEMMMATLTAMSFESRTSDQLRNMKNYCIIMNTLMRKAAEKGRVHPVYLDRVSSDFAHRIEALRSLSAVTDFVLELMRTYCRLVKRHSMRNYSPLVQKAMILIESDLTGDLSLRSVAERNNVSPGYLSGLFKKETGQTFTAYVNGRRIAMAKNLLKTTHLQVQTVAQHCGILDFHYFCRLFKHIVGKTPTEYRSSHTIE